MPSLTDLVAVKQAQSSSGESNLEQGQIYSFSEGNEYTKFQSVDNSGTWCWFSPGNGTVLLEIWGAGGSSSRQCCCATSIPGNSGAFSKKTFTVVSNDKIYGCTGFACGNAGDRDFRGCSQPTMVCWTGNGADGCMCAEGGKAGYSCCTGSTSPYCAWTSFGLCTLRLDNDNCGLVCNHRDGDFIPSAFGGDVNCSGYISCMSYLGCYGMCLCCHMQHVVGPAGVVSTDGVQLTFTADTENPGSNWSGMGMYGFQAAMSGVGRMPSQGAQLRACWAGNVFCGCYEQNGCYSVVPYGFGAPAGYPCPSVRDVGYRGGMGNTRIKFIES